MTQMTPSEQVYDTLVSALQPFAHGGGSAFDAVQALIWLIQAVAEDHSESHRDLTAKYQMATTTLNQITATVHEWLKQDGLSHELEKPEIRN